MAESKNISFTAVDIDKYHRNLLSPKERHALEKAALEDPFLAEALEGFEENTEPVNLVMTDLQTRLQTRIEGEEEKTKVIPIASAGSSKKNFALLRAAVIVVAVAGAGILGYQLLLNPQEEVTIAQATDPVKNETIVKKEDTLSPKLLETTTAPIFEETSDIVKRPQLVKTTSAPTAIYDDRTATTAMPKVEMAPVNILADEEEKAKLEEVKIAKSNTYNFETNAKKENAIKGNSNDKAFLQRNIFRGRIVDEKNNGVPFASVTYLNENVGTYTDVNGYFNLTSPDTLLGVQIKSIGFETVYTPLSTAKSINSIILQEDKRSVPIQTLITGHSNAERKSVNTAGELTETEPLVGWTNYDLYLLNNLNVPETFPMKNSSVNEVTLSFEVDTQGNPVAIRVEKSLCETCDKEAIRLIKAGPKFKATKNQKRTTVAVPFVLKP